GPLGSMKDILSNYSNLIYLNKYVKEKDKYINDYRIIRTLNQGKFNKIILCEKDNKFYALKKYEKSLLEKKRDFTKSNNDKISIKSKYDDFKNELQIITDIKNEYCLTCEGIITNYDEVYIIYEYMENDSILKFDEYFFVLDKNYTCFIPIQVIKCIIKSVLNSFSYIHNEKNICHRDVKPSNILMDKNGRVKLSDFGESEYMVDKKIKGSRGTYEFMPPEFFSNESSYNGAKVDIWSLGICLYVMFYNVVPFSLKISLVELFNNIRTKNIEYPLDRNHFLYPLTNKKSTCSNNFLSNEDIDFLKLFLRKNPAERITSEDALKHEWLADTNIEDLREFSKELYKKRKKL
uniref:Ser/Thr protein kinase n=1 Tax=Plasmodium falciparum TaxID=5833 RepID=UPI000181CDEA|nr:Chain X, Ser/Thr protein kinase [Plasmodium falciparum]2PMN_X Chain X, Ser/Thr protein kinase, putative [Plasmodium falciparum]2PMO_X Chain X, Ser/Thr protein kinase [Plasmodium falciparum]